MHPCYKKHDRLNTLKVSGVVCVNKAYSPKQELSRQPQLHRGGEALLG